MKLINIIIGVIAIQLLLLSTVINGQQYVIENTSIRLTAADSIYASNLPELKLPQLYKSGKARDLPSELNNSTLPFFRPTFSQSIFWNCGQAAGIGYNFTYEINVARGLNGDTSINQYSPNFTYNFMNTGAGWGVSYFNSFDAIKACGNPNLYDYGGLFNGGFTRWMTGYELYENAMQNRIENVYSIDIGTPEGLITLKYWLLDHLNGSEFGGVANFYFQFNWSGTLPPESPDAGFPVIIEAGDFAGHAMTIVGFNDSIRFDINEDGQFTNTIDINNDSIVDMKDWEIGGLKYINSNLANNGAGYLMYRTLAFKYGEGGIWNQQAHVLTVKENYEPLMTMRVKIRGTSRNKLKVIAGISTDIAANYPEFTMDFPIFNYQGGDQYMQGGDTIESHKTIEFALDISPLFSHVSDDSPTKFFLQIAENDRYNFGDGEILYYSIVDHTNGLSEIVCNDVPQTINDNAITTLQVSHTPSFEKVVITTEELPGISPGINQIVQIEAESGYPPYSWELLNPYALNLLQSEFPEINDEQLIFDNIFEGRLDVELPFLFPFYGDTVQNITIHSEGFIMFENEPYPYPYFVGEESIIKAKKVIAPFMSDLILLNEKDDGVWINSYDDYVGIRWKASAETTYGESDVNFCVMLFPDGKIETHYESMDYPETRLWSAGISSGDKTNFIINSMGHHLDEISNTSFEFLPPPDLLPDSLSINKLGELSVLINDESQIYPITIQVKDDKGITDVASYNISSFGLTFNYSITPGNGTTINYNDTSMIGLFIDNNSPETYENIVMKFTSLSEFIELNDTIVDIGTLEPNQTANISGATNITVLPQVPDGYNTVIRCDLTSGDEQWTSNIILTINAPDFKIIETQIIDNNDQVLYPGETGRIKFTIQNTGHARSSDVTTNLSTAYEHINIVPFGANNIDTLYPGDTTSVEFIIAASYFVPVGTDLQLMLEIFNSETTFTTLYTHIRIGHIPVLIVDLDPKQISGLQIQDILNDIGLQNTYSSFIPNNLNEYMSVFVCLGGLFDSHLLSEYEGAMLVDFLNSSGKVYMEGSSTWTSLYQTSVHNMFNLRANPPGNYFILDTIIGVNEDYTKEFAFNIDEDHSYINYFMHPLDGATTFFINNDSDTSGVVIANQNEDYSTIGSSILFGTLIDIDTVNTKEDYLLSILDYFGIKKYIYVDMEEVKYNSNNNIDIEVYPNPVNDLLTIELFNSSKMPSTFQILNIHGKLIKEQRILESTTENSTTTTWNCRDSNGKTLSGGIYFIRYTCNNMSVTKKIILN